MFRKHTLVYERNILCLRRRRNRFNAQILGVNAMAAPVAPSTLPRHRDAVAHTCRERHRLCPDKHFLQLLRTPRTDLRDTSSPHYRLMRRLHHLLHIQLRGSRPAAQRTYRHFRHVYPAQRLPRPRSRSLAFRHERMTSTSAKRHSATCDTHLNN